jgi:CheY-like chemotaxis protein
MPARIILVQSNPELLDAAAATIRAAGHDVMTFADPIEALAALEQHAAVELLITRLRFGPGKPHGRSLALMAKLRRPGLKILFTALPEFRDQADHIGEFLPHPVDPAELATTINRLLANAGVADA